MSVCLCFSFFSVSVPLCVCLSVSLSLEGGLPLISCRSENFVSHLEVSKRRLIGVNMPLSGLPVAVNGVLTDLQEQALTSWKVVGDTTVTVVVLRFSPADPATIATSQPDHSQVTFRKKPPSQVQRDCKRAEERQKARADQASVLDFANCSMPLFMPTPPAKQTDIDSRPAEKQLADSAHVECETNACETR